MNLRRRSAFALVELLVTIAIIGIPLELLLPDLAAMQATAKAGRPTTRFATTST